MIFILGEKPGKNTDPSDPLFPHTNNGAAARLIRLLGLTQEEYLAGTIRQNAVYLNGSTSSSVARLHTEEFLVEAGSEPFIVLGKSARQAMPAKFRNMDFGDIVANVLLLPHTSGLNRLWNDPEYTSRMERIAREFIYEKDSGVNRE